MIQKVQTSVRVNVLSFGKFSFKENRGVIEDNEKKEILGYVYPSSAYSGSIFVDVSKE